MASALGRLGKEITKDLTIIDGETWGTIKWETQTIIIKLFSHIHFFLFVTLFYYF